MSGVVAVSGMIANENPGPGAGVIRSLRAHPSFSGRIVGLAYDAFESASFLPGIADDVFLMPYPSQSNENYFQRLLYIRRETGLDTLIPALDSELLPVIHMASRLREAGIRTFLPNEGQFKLRAKAVLEELEEKHGLPVPRSRTVYDTASALAASREFGFPVFVKGIFYEAYCAHSEYEVEVHFQRLQVKWGLPVVLQENVPGEEYDVAALGDGTGGMVGAVPMKKMQLSEKGKAWGGVTVSDDTLLELTRKTLAALRWRGPLELEIMQSAADGAYYILEINPRFPSWIYLAQGAGQNLPYACLQLAREEAVETFPECKPGVMFTRAALDYVVPLASIEALSLHGELRRPLLGE